MRYTKGIVITALLLLFALLPAASCGQDLRMIHLLVFDGLADWEVGLVTYELNTRNAVPVVTVGFTADPVTTGGGLTVFPDVSLADVDPLGTAMLMLPGGEMWHGLESPELEKLIRELHDAGVPIAAICAATSYLARVGLLSDGVSHTSNSFEYLTTVAPDYGGEDAYVDAPAVSDQGIITASGDASIEFTYYVLKELRVYDAHVLTEFAQFWRSRVP